MVVVVVEQCWSSRRNRRRRSSHSIGRLAADVLQTFARAGTGPNPSNSTKGIQFKIQILKVLEGHELHFSNLFQSFQFHKYKIRSPIGSELTEP